jgi:hypothetical protein
LQIFLDVRPDFRLFPVTPSRIAGYWPNALQVDETVNLHRRVMGTNIDRTRGVDLASMSRRPGS